MTTEFDYAIRSTFGDKGGEGKDYGKTDCAGCGEPFTRMYPNHAYCSGACKTRAKRQREKARARKQGKPALPEWRACAGPGCKQAFLAKRKDSFFCSNPCRRRARSTLRQRKTPLERTCKECKTIFTPRPNQLYCSQRCQNTASRRRWASKPESKEKINKARAAWRARNPGYAAKDMRRRYWLDPEKYRARARRYRLENLEAVKERQRKRRRQEK